MLTFPSHLSDKIIIRLEDTLYFFEKLQLLCVHVHTKNVATTTHQTYVSVE